MALTTGISRETLAGEKRVATVSEVVEKLIKPGFKVAEIITAALPMNAVGRVRRRAVRESCRQKPGGR